MYQKKVIAISFAATLLAAHMVEAGGRGNSAEPWIDSTRIDTQRSIVTVQGDRFGSATPSVYLGKQPLKVIESSDQEIVAELPANVGAASYRMVVITGSPTRISSAPFFTTILAARE